jgi:hypothetical protein
MNFCLKSLAFFLIMVVIFSPNITLSDSNSIWGNYEKTYIYSYVKEIYFYDDSERLTAFQQNSKEYYFSNFSVNNNVLFFRTSDYMIVEPFLIYSTQDDLFRLLGSKFDFYQTNMSIKLGYVFDEENKLYYLVDAHLKPFANFYEFSYPFDMINLFLVNQIWDYFYGFFLPTKSPFFGFRTDYSNHEGLNYSTFKIEIENDFRYSGRKYNGYDIKIEFTEGMYFGYSVVFENHKIEYKYSDLGILYYFNDEAEVYTNISSIESLEYKYNQIIRLSVAGDKIYKSDSTSIFISIAAFFVIVIMLNKRKQKRLS